MSLQQMLIVAAAVMLAALAVSRVVRVSIGRPPHPAGRGRIPFLIAFFFLPPIALEIFVLSPTTSAAQLHVIESMLVYGGALVVFWLAMSVAALVVHLLARGRPRRWLLIALLGSEVETDEVPFDPVLTPGLAESVASVQAANAAFPRGPAFPAQVHRGDFRMAWAALDASTTELEGRIADDRRRGLAVASSASYVAHDARDRLDSLRHIADHSVGLPTAAWIESSHD